VNVFLAPERFDSVREALAPLGVETSVDSLALARDGQCRLRWGRTPVDVFFAYDPIHDAMRSATRSVPFADTNLPILSPEHLAVCKAVFDRPQDWIDVEQMMVGAEGFERGEVDAWLARIVGPDSEALRRFRALADEHLGPL